MPIRPCPTCANQTPRELDSLSKVAYVYYYRCEPCGHVWTLPKDNPDAPTRTVTPGRLPPQVT